MDRSMRAEFFGAFVLLFMGGLSISAGGGDLIGFHPNHFRVS